MTYYMAIVDERALLRVSEARICLHHAHPRPDRMVAGKGVEAGVQRPLQQLSPWIISHDPRHGRRQKERELPAHDLK